MPSQNSATSPAPSLDLPVPDGNKRPLSFDEVLDAEKQFLRRADAVSSTPGGSVRAAPGNNPQDIPRSALCISGGGIRSATFALGALQALADLEILDKFDYLSTVSGGGYIGSWLTAWKKRAGSLAQVLPGLKTPVAFASAPIPDPVQHLREYNNYLSPKLGLFSADTWTLVATVVRNMLLNWLVFIPLLMAMLMLPRIILSLARLGEVYKAAYWPGIVRIMDYLNDHHILPVFGGVLFATGVFNVLAYLPSLGNKNRSEAQFIRFCLTPLLLAGVAVLTMDAWFSGGDHTTPEVSFTQWFRGIAVSGGAGWLLYIVSHWKDMRQKWKAILGLSVALAFTVLSLAEAAWLLTQHYADLSWPVYVTTALPLLLLSFALTVTFFVGLSSRVLEDEDREWLSRAGAWVLLTILAWLGICALVLLAPGWAIAAGHKAESALAAAGGISGCLAALAGLSGKTESNGESGTEAQQNGAGQQNGKKGALLNVAAKLAAPIFVVVFLVTLALLTNWIIWKTGRIHQELKHHAVVVHWGDHRAFLENTRTEDGLGLGLIFLGIAFVMGYYININKFSLHAMYRSRLIRAYPGASNDRKEYVNKFTGFSKNDNMWMADLLDSGKPFHVINICLNLVSGKRLAWQQRKAESFTVTPLHCGSHELGYRPAAHYGGPYGISLGTAVAISGAAASPNMGYHSSSALTFIMTLFNARLGAWLGNPKQERWRDEGPKSAFSSIVLEAFGLTDDTRPYVYLSDGGHFENLALYEMIWRRCRYIFVLDGAADPKYNYIDLGNALRKIRIDMKVSIEFEEPFLAPLSRPQYRCANRQNPLSRQVA